MEAGGSFKMEKLQKSNFHVLKQKVDVVLAFRGLDDRISDPQAPLGPNELNEWKKNNAKAKAVIPFTLRDEHFEHVRNTESALDMWTEVMNLFQN